MERLNKTAPKRCVICGKNFTEWGNNPYPVKETGTCCNSCNFEFVLPARILALRK